MSPALRTLLLLAGLLALAGCEQANMAEQPKARTWDRNPYFAKHMTMRDPVPGTVPRQDPAAAAPQPATITAASLERGRERYGIFCTPCHGASGDGNGIVVQRGFPHAGNLAADRLRQASAADLYRIVGEGHRAMFGMAQMIPSADRWAIVAYLRALQLSQGAEVASLPEADRARLEAAR
ncbi:c-type cytochrome [Methylobacterium radiodurans]|uniref:Cytochrome C n=1 Tax=Methylobacterium radiodurans TaxID=2202828 RepID=A0A2U8VMI2_9HYPH|nr:cytochrome c [Methylobacterium radiodurans]AWN34787.1 cytochrome C [Methylobacterium radiodurans]